jgi:hypothetical protein
MIVFLEFVWLNAGDVSDVPMSRMYPVLRIGRREYETFRPLRRLEIGDTIAQGTIIDTED